MNSADVSQTVPGPDRGDLKSATYEFFMLAVAILSIANLPLLVIYPYKSPTSRRSTRCSTSRKRLRPSFAPSSSSSRLAKSATSERLTRSNTARNRELRCEKCKNGRKAPDDLAQPPASSSRSSIRR